MDRAWIKHHGRGCPLPKGTLIEVRHFNGEVSSGVRVGGICVARDGSPLPQSCARWSGWDYSDGGPMAPKFREYRVIEVKRQAGMDVFRQMLPQKDAVPA